MEKNFITEEDKAVLRKVAKYLRSYNVRSGVIQIEVDYYSNIESFFENTPNFSNNWGVEIPDFFRPYLTEIAEKVVSNLKDLDIQDVNYDYVTIDIDSIDSTLDITRYWGYEQPGDTLGTTWGEDTENEDEVEMVKKLMDEIMESGARPNSNGFFQVDYNGSGDSGYIEGSFYNGGRVPANIEDWCYEKLESIHGGWEINEGSKGYFTFDTKNNLIELEHTFNEQVEDSDEILSVNFGKPKE